MWHSYTRRYLIGQEVNVICDLFIHTNATVFKFKKTRFKWPREIKEMIMKSYNQGIGNKEFKVIAWFLNSLRILRLTAVRFSLFFSFLFFFWKSSNLRYPLLMIKRPRHQSIFSIHGNWTSNLLYNYQRFYQLS